MFPLLNFRHIRFFTAPPEGDFVVTFHSGASVRLSVFPSTANSFGAAIGKLIDLALVDNKPSSTVGETEQPYSLAIALVTFDWEGKQWYAAAARADDTVTSARPLDSNDKAL